MARATIWSAPLWVLLASIPSLAQTPPPPRLNENCIVSVLNRNTRVRADGTWILPNVPANFGLVRARATCVADGRTISGESAPFLISAEGSVDVPPIVLGASTPVPRTLTLASASPQLGQIGATSQLLVVAEYSDDSTRDVSGADTGTKYIVSNPAIATVTGDGLVTALASGTVLLQATHEGTSGFTSVRVVLSADSDGDGMPDDLELSLGLNPNNPADAFEDLDRDGLSNRDEALIGTNLRDVDSDDDSLSDGEEVRTGVDGFITNPLLADTDGDGVRDALEISTGTDPTDSNSVDLTRALTGITAAPTTFTIIVNTVVGVAYTQLTVTGQLRDGSTIDLTPTARGTNYASNDLDVCNFGSPDGRVFGGESGNCTITITSAGFTAQASGSVTTFSPTARGSVAIPGYANNVDVNGGYAYVAAGAAGLQVVSVGDPMTPTIVGSLDTPGNANDVRVVGTTAYVADGFAGLRIIDVSDPTRPVLLGSLDTSGEASDVLVVGTLAYVADGSSGLQIISVANPAAPLLVRTVSTSGYARGVDVNGSIAVVADDSGLVVISVENPSAAAVIGALSLTGQSIDVSLSGNSAIVAAYTGGMHVVDITDPTTPIRVGGLPGEAPNGFVPRDVQVAGGFALFAEQLFANAVAPVVDIGAPTTPVLRGVVDFGQDYAGTGIAVSGAHVYWTGQSFVVGDENGVAGTTRLFIGQYLAVEDRAGVPPTVSIVSPTTGTTVIEGSTLTTRVSAVDDVAVRQVEFVINGQLAFTDTSEPYEYTFNVATGVSTLVIGARATDLGGNVGVASNATLTVVPDPLTTVVGRVVDVDNRPLVGATVTTFDRPGITDEEGGFTILGVPTARGAITVNVQFTPPDGEPVSGASLPTTPVASGITNVGTITAAATVFETNYGELWTNSDDVFEQFPLPFPFTFYGQTYTDAFVGSNGYITFNEGDTTYIEALESFASLPRISAFFDDLYGARGDGAVYVNSSLPGRFVVTHLDVPHFSDGGSNTLQLQLFADGRILFAFKCISSTTTGSITGLTPGPSAPLLQADFSQTPTFETPAGASVFEYFTSENPFDLSNMAVLFTPVSGGGFSVRVMPLSGNSGSGGGGGGNLNIDEPCVGGNGGGNGDGNGGVELLRRPVKMPVKIEKGRP